MGIYVYRARSPKKGLQEVTVGNETVKVAVAEYAYKVSYDKYGQEAYGGRYINPTERAWENWLDEGNERPEYIIYNEKFYRWNGLIGFYDHAPESWEEMVIYAAHARTHMDEVEEANFRNSVIDPRLVD